ncbi:MAG: N-acetyltransferase [Chloroflexi bacterium]|nr:N-acetyltransferase [Chloroflexota bacterium]
MRSEEPRDVRGIATVVGDAFGDPSLAELVARLRASPDWIADLSIVALHDDSVVGHIAFTRALLDAPRRLVDVLVLSPVSVAPAHQGMGVGAALIRHGLRRLSARPEPLVFVEGSPAYYRRFGFEPAGALGFRRPSLRIPEAAFQVIRLGPYEPWMTGTLVYSRVFWDMDAVGLREAGEGDAQSS